MTADLPSIHSAFGRTSAYPVLGLQCHTETTADLDISSYHHDDQHFPTVEHQFNNSKRNSEGHALKVKFAPSVTSPAIEKMKSVMPGFDSTMNVDHKHYEQWARVPGRRMTSSTLLRGIQALKARLKRESMEQERNETVVNSRDLHINPLNRNSLLTRDKLSDDNYVNLRRERSNMSRESAARQPNQPRSPLKTTSRTIDSGVFRQNNDDVSGNEIKERDTAEATVAYNMKSRATVLKSREKCPLQVSVYQPISIGAHVFLVNEPIKYTEFLKMKKTEYRIKKDPKSATMIIMPDKSGKLVNLPDTTEVDTQADDLMDGFQRSRTMAGGFPPSKHQKRTPSTEKRSQVIVSNAELFDFTQLSEFRQLLEERHLERSKTEFCFPSKGGKYTKWVPNVQKLKEYVK